MIGGVLIDLSGVLYVGEHALPGAGPALQSLRAARLPLRFITNTTRSTTEDILRRLQGMGLEVSADEIYSAPVAAQRYLLDHQLRPYLLVHQRLRRAFEAQQSTPDQADTVLVGDAAEGFSYSAMNTAFRILMRGGRLVAMGRNRYFRDGDELSLDADPFVRALEYAAGVQAVITGKPDGEFFRGALASMDLQPADVVMVGDDVEADVQGAVACGLRGILVQTGKYRPGDEQRLTAPYSHLEADFGAAASWILARAS